MSLGLIKGQARRALGVFYLSLLLCGTGIMSGCSNAAKNDTAAQIKALSAQEKIAK